MEAQRRVREEAADLAGNPGQHAAYDSTGHCVLLAGPGSRKTKKLVLKLARILAEDVWAAPTFTSEPKPMGSRITTPTG